MRPILLGLFLLTVSSLTAQRECTTLEYTTSLIKNNLQIERSLSEAESFTQRRATSATGSTMRLATDYIVRIPIVVHILYNDPSQNLSDAQVQSQVDALNRDFRRLNPDSVNTPAAFKSLAADVQIEFVLATADPKGKATNGIVRKPTSVKYWQMDDKIKYTAQGGDDAWDSRSYLNIWVGYTRTLLGYSSVVGAPAEKDGLVINSSAFGTLGVSGDYNKGRTAVHEVGHWLGLKHIWGDAQCGDDGIYDTPPQNGYTSSCPTGIKTSSCNSTAGGDMYMNYMDFTNDGCLNLFTRGQKERMRSMFDNDGPRYSILSSKGLSTPWVEESPIPEQISPVVTAPLAFKIYPNPASGEITLDFQYDASWIGKQVLIFNVNGISIQTVKITSNNQKVSLAGLSTGIYFVKATNGSITTNHKFIKL
jgi:hypothetical protein